MRLYVSRLSQTSFYKTQLDLVGLVLNISFDSLVIIKIDELFKQYSIRNLLQQIICKFLLLSNSFQQHATFKMTMNQYLSFSQWLGAQINCKMLKKAILPILQSHIKVDNKSYRQPKFKKTKSIMYWKNIEIKLFGGGKKTTILI